jgi:hypothetical protein
MLLRENHDAAVGSDRPAEHLGGDSTRGPVRRCIVTGATQPVGKLVRFVVGPDDRIVPDVCAVLPGRGMWLSADRNSVKTAQARQLFSRAERRAVSVDDDLADHVETLLARRCLELIGLARRGSQSICGFVKVRRWLEEGCIGGLVIAADCAAGGREKLASISTDAPVIRTLTADEIGQAFGRKHAVFAALRAGNLARKFVAEAMRLDGFRGSVDLERESRRVQNEVDDE